VSAPTVNWSPDPSEMLGLLTKIPLRNKNNKSCLNECREKNKSKIDQVEDIKI
jgi:hypothetical protein